MKQFDRGTTVLSQKCSLAEQSAGYMVGTLDGNEKARLLRAHKEFPKRGDLNIIVQTVERRRFRVIVDCAYRYATR